MRNSYSFPSEGCITDQSQSKLAVVCGVWFVVSKKLMDLFGKNVYKCPYLGSETLHYHSEVTAGLSGDFPGSKYGLLAHIYSHG